MDQERIGSGVLAAAAAGTGVLLGYLGARVVLVGSGLSLVPWAVAGLALGACARSRPAAVAVGVVFGFALAFTFMTTGYDGTAPLRTRLFSFVVLGVVGAACGAVLATAGRSLRRRVEDRAS